ncbi:hypothetical protein DO97_04820 [Neosynechococcus sphagnicola sy1]|uniref:Uncharacterized protein n=1 Tax=Neosynechococcus sphagnicola sy1 TaxID=1497020 RepID=A0A098TPP4_9CYAN|nr:hypothetical protein [Neosynechococcus sphagnicola]KGF72803.1 hypothetical protein DO97_04820 [Neosynechococcus sphagnicola sy1]
MSGFRSIVLQGPLGKTVLIRRKQDYLAVLFATGFELTSIALVTWVQDLNSEQLPALFPHHGHRRIAPSLMAA